MGIRWGYASSMRALPRYGVLALNYPNKHQVTSKALLDRLGGEVRKTLSDHVNTCAVRVSDALNRSGRPIQKMSGLYQLLGATPQRLNGRLATQPSRYIIRVPDMKKYLEREYGMGKLIYDAMKRPTTLANLPHKTQGIIVFVWNGGFREFGASGHVDLFHVWPNGANPPHLQPECEGQCYWWVQGGPMQAYLWEAMP